MTIFSRRFCLAKEKSRRKGGGREREKKRLNKLKKRKIFLSSFLLFLFQSIFQFFYFNSFFLSFNLSDFFLSAFQSFSFLFLPFPSFFSLLLLFFSFFFSPQLHSPVFALKIPVSLLHRVVDKKVGVVRRHQSDIQIVEEGD